MYSARYRNKGTEGITNIKIQVLGIKDDNLAKCGISPVLKNSVIHFFIETRWEKSVVLPKKVIKKIYNYTWSFLLSDWGTFRSR